MSDDTRTKKQLIDEVNRLRRRVDELEQAELKRLAAEQKLQDLNTERDQVSAAVEESIARSNYMAVESELVYLELNQMFNAGGDGVWAVDKDCNILRINKTLSRIIGVKVDEALKNKCYDLLNIPLCHTGECPMNLIKKGRRRVECDVELVRADGTACTFSITATPFKGLSDEIVGMVANYKDITDRKRAEAELQEANRKLEELATQDGLTKTANRRLFDGYLRREWNRQSRKNQPVSLIMCDIDYFKLYNDTYGHVQGDECLCSVAGAITTNVNRAADVVARYGGEEFAVIMPETDAEGAMHVANSIMQTVNDLNLEHSGSAVSPRVTLSIGVACMVPEPTLDPETLIEAADKALYTSKETGRNRITLIQDE